MPSFFDERKKNQHEPNTNAVLLYHSQKLVTELESQVVVFVCMWSVISDRANENGIKT